MRTHRHRPLCSDRVSALSQCLQVVDDGKMYAAGRFETFYVATFSRAHSVY